MHTIKHAKAVRATFVFIGIGSLIAAAGLSLRNSPFPEIWPLRDDLAAERFLGVYQAGIGASLLWIGLSGDLGAAVAGAISMTVINSGLAITWFTRSSGATSDPRPAALGCVAAALVSAGLALWFRRCRVRDVQPLPRTVQGAFVVYVLLLAFVGVALLTGMPNIFYAALSPTAAALIGWCFLGSAVYFLYSLAFPVWRNARAQLWGFLAYDLALIMPLLSRLGSSDTAHRPALVLNIAVLVFSGALAIYYLLIATATRVWSPRLAQKVRQATPLKTIVTITRKTASLVRSAQSAE